MVEEKKKFDAFRFKLDNFVYALRFGKPREVNPSDESIEMARHIKEMELRQSKDKPKGLSIEQTNKFLEE